MRVVARVLLALALVASLPAAGRAQADAQRVQSGISVTPDTVTVGDPYVVAIRVRAPRGATIAFPEPPPTEPFQVVEAVDPRDVRTSPDTTAVEQTARYRFVAWRPGQLTLGLDDVIVTSGGRSTRISLADQRIIVRSVLPADTALRVPKPARDVIAPLRPLWHYVLAVALALLLLALLAWWLWRRRRGAPGGAPSAFAEAEREFERIEALRLVEAGERGRHVALMVDVLRDYLAARHPAIARSLTSWEVLQAARGVRTVPTARLEPVLAEADLIKFARRAVTMDRAREIGREARSIVHEIEDRERVAAEAAAAEQRQPREAA